MIDGRYSDDTEMTIGVMEALVEDPDLDPAKVASRFLHNFTPWRGYGPRTRRAIERLREGIPWQEVGSDSFGNGGAMRSAPIGFFYYDDLDAVREKAALCASITHRHPEGIAGAVVQALSVAVATRWALQGRPLDRGAFLDEVLAHSGPLPQAFREELQKVMAFPPVRDVAHGAELLALTFPLDATARGSVPAALAALLSTQELEAAILVAVNAGGDADTVGAMTGALAGAYYGASSIPLRWTEALEGGERGKDHVRTLARRLWEIKVHEKGGLL